MKKFILGLVVALITTVTVKAQTVTYYLTLSSDDAVVSLSGLGNSDTDGYGANAAPVQATLTGPDTATYYVRVKGKRSNMTWNAIIDETGSGTLAGTLVVKACTNYIGSRTNWYSLSFLKWKTLHSDTIVDGDQEFSYADHANDYQYYMVQIINSASTTVCKVFVTLTLRQ